MVIPPLCQLENGWGEKTPLICYADLPCLSLSHNDFGFVV